MNNSDLPIAETDIAIIGMAAKFPQANTLEAYWENLKAGRNCITFFSDEELLAAGVPSAQLKRSNYVKAAGVIPDADQFDAAFFGFSPREAELIDPQHRLFLEQAWTALEHAGYAAANPGSVGVFVGVGMNLYLLKSLYPNLLAKADLDSYQVQIRNDKDFLPTLVSYKLNLQGPSLAVQTACSTSLVASHLACQSLLNGECDLSLAGGATIYANPTGYAYTEGMILSPDGYCRAFDAKAQGTVGGSGVGVVVLKRLADAIADQDTVYAVIKGSAINNDGAGKVGFTAPSVEGQAAVIAEAQAIANTPAETISYIEAHGTGTALGDPIEVAALTQAFRHTTTQTQFCALGSVKTNLGHLDTAAGVASLIKVALALHHEAIPPSLHFESPNPVINFAQSPFFVNTQLQPWPKDEVTHQPRRAGVSSFGIGGTNAHVIVEEAPTPEIAKRYSQRYWQGLLLSAKTETALAQQRQQLAHFLSQHPDIDLADVAFTLAQGRQAFAHRSCCFVQTVEEAITALSTPQAEHSGYCQPEHRPKVVFLFPGQGSQTLDMGRELYEHEPQFRQAFDHCAELLQPHLNADIRQVLYPQGTPIADLAQTQWSQPILFAFEYACAQLWQHWGIQPEAMVGHSLGEYVAACLAGVFSLDDGLRLVASRALLMQKLPAGAMLAIPGTAADLLPWLENTVTPWLATQLGSSEAAVLSLAAENGGLCTVSGSVEAIALLESQLLEAGKASTRLKTDHAFHSPLVESMMDAFRQVLSTIPLQPPERAYFSNVTGTWIEPAQATDPDYWLKHLRQTVRFGEAISQLLQDSNRIFLEVGPGRTLTGLVRRHPDYTGQHPLLNTLPHPGAVPPAGQTINDPEPKALLHTLGQLWLRGVPCKWKRFYRGEVRRRIPLPTYPFERQRHWMEPPTGTMFSPFGLARTLDPSQWFYAPSWKQLTVPATYPWPEIPDPNTSWPTQQSWLVFLDDVGVGSAIAKQLTAAGQRVFTILEGDRPGRQKADFTMPVADYPSLVQILQLLKAQDQFPHHILHGWSLVPETTVNPLTSRFRKTTPTNLDDGTIDHQLNRGLYSVLALAQAMGKVGQPYPTQIGVITQGAYRILGTESLQPLTNTLLGAIKVIPQEYRDLTCRFIDLESTAEKHLQTTDGLQTLLMDWLNPATPMEIAYRGRSRWTPCLEATPLDEPTPLSRLRPQGVYLVTGGLGGIGLTLARYLAATVQARLILLSRAPLPPAADWVNWCQTHEEADPTRRKIETVQSLEALGATVWLAQADVADVPALQEALNTAQAALGPIQGVVHCAGLADFGGIIQGRSREQTSVILSAKVAGTLALKQVLGDRPLDFWVLSSSLSTVLYKTLFGQVGYSAANEFLSAFAADLQSQGQPTVAIHWTEWDEVGMAVDARAERLKTKAQPEAEDDWLEPLTPEDGATAFARILGSPLPQIMVCPQDLPTLVYQQLQWNAADFLEALAVEPDAGRPKQPRPALLQPFSPPRTQIEAQLAQLWESYLGIAPVGIDDSFSDLGGDSLLALGLLAQIHKQLGVTVPTTVMVETPTISGIVNYLSLESPEAIAPLLAPLSSAVDDDSPPPTASTQTLAIPVSIAAASKATDDRAAKSMAATSTVLQPSQPLGVVATPSTPSVAHPSVAHPAVVAPSSVAPSVVPPSVAPSVVPPSVATPLVLSLQPGSPDEYPLFFMHPIGGGVSCYTPLTRYLTPSVPFYGIRAIGLEEDHPPLSDLQLIAKTYIQAIREIQPHGPYFLGGWSMGGVIAYEMAYQLLQMQEPIIGLMLIDSPAPVATPLDPSQDVLTFARGLGYPIEPVRPLSRALKSESISWDGVVLQLHTLGLQLGVLPVNFPLTVFVQLHRTFMAHRQALAAYTAGRWTHSTIPSLYFEAQTVEGGWFAAVPKNHWKQLLGRGLMIRDLPGDHFSLLTDPQVRPLANYLNAFLKFNKPRQ